MSNVLHSLITSVALTAAALASSAPALSQPIDQVPMYGGMDRSATPRLKAADEKLIEDTTRHYGSRAAASMAFANQGFAYYKRDDFQNAMRRFNQAWLLNPDNPEAYWGFASVLFEQERFCEATNHMETALAKGGLQPGALPDAAILLVGCAMTEAAEVPERKAALLAKSEEMFAQAMSSGAPKDYTLLMWARAKLAQDDYIGAWAKVKELRDSTGKSPPPQFLQALQAKMPAPGQ